MLFVIVTVLGLLIVSGTLYEMSKVLLIVAGTIWYALAILMLYIFVKLAETNGEYVFIPFLKTRLRHCNNRWQSTIIQIKLTGDYGMCCGEREAIACAKEHCFGELIKYADEFEPQVEVYTQ